MPSISLSKKNNKLYKLLFSHRRHSSAPTISTTKTALDASLTCSSDDDEAMINKHQQHQHHHDDHPLLKQHPNNTSNNNNNSSKKRLRKGVHFSTEEPTIVINTSEGLSSEERQAAFWSTQELANIKQDIKETVCWLTSGRGGGSSSSARGLEKWFEPIQYRDARQCLIRAVLAEQRIQQSEGHSDVEMIADASLDCTKTAGEAALTRAQDDHQCVLALLREKIVCPLAEDKIFGQHNCMINQKRLRLGRRCYPRRATMPHQQPQEVEQH